MIKDIDVSLDLIPWLIKLGFVKSENMNSNGSLFGYFLETPERYIIVLFYNYEKQFYLYKYDIEDEIFNYDYEKLYDKVKVVNYLNNAFKNEFRKMKIKNLLDAEK
jgi:hypothetical protein